MNAVTGILHTRDILEPVVPAREVLYNSIFRGKAAAESRLVSGGELTPDGDVLDEEDPIEPVLRSAINFEVAHPRVEREVLRHRRVGVEPDLGNTELDGLALCVRQQGPAVTASLQPRVYRNVLDQ